MRETTTAVVTGLNILLKAMEELAGDRAPRISALRKFYKTEMERMGEFVAEPPVFVPEPVEIQEIRTQIEINKKRTRK